MQLIDQQLDDLFKFKVGNGNAHSHRQAGGNAGGDVDRIRADSGADVHTIGAYSGKGTLSTSACISGVPSAVRM